MNAHEIDVGRLYTNAKGSYRLVTGTIALPFSRRPEDEWLSYVVATTTSSGNASSPVRRRSCTRGALASWASFEAEMTELAPRTRDMLAAA